MDDNKQWKILKEMGISDHDTCLLYKGQEETVRMGHRTTDRFKIWKGVHGGCILSPCTHFYVEYIMQMLGWMKHKLGSRLPGETSTTSDMQMIPL